MQQSNFLRKLSRTSLAKFHLSVLTTCLAGFSTTALAQQGLLEEVIVTAQKREQSVQDVGISITAFSGEQLQTIGIVNSTELARYTPGVSMSGGGGDYRQEFTIRGATQNDFADHAEAPNAVYVDEVYQAAQQAQLFTSYDMQRVEILKGPQGTLFGRNATGGLVHFVTNKPTHEFETFADVTYGSYDSVRTEAAVSGGLTETISARLSGIFNTYDTPYKNDFSAADVPPTPGALAAFGRGPLTVNPDPNDKGGEDAWSIRGQLLFEPNEDVELLVKGQYADQEFSATAYNSIATIAFVDDTDGDGFFDDTVNTAFQQDVGSICEMINASDGSCVNSVFDADFDGVRPNSQGDFFGYVDPGGTEDLSGSTDHTPDPGTLTKIYNLTGKLTWDLDFARLVAVSGYTDLNYRQSLDVGDAPVPQFIFARQSELEWFSQELRLEGEQDRMSWIAGAYYLNVDVKAAQGLEDTIGGINILGGLFFGPVFNSALNLITGEAGLGVGGDTFLEATTSTELGTDSYSLFGQIDYDLTDQFMVNIGFRAIIEEKDFSYKSRLYLNTRDGRTDGALFAGATPLGLFFAPTTPLEFLDPYEDSTSDFLWSGKLQLNYTPNDDWLFYAGVNRGVKAGSFNGPLLTSLTQDEYGYDEEILLAYEGGFKSTLLNGKARFNFSVFYYDYKDYQAFQFVGTSGAVFNADAESVGFEAELVANSINNFDFWLGLSYIDAEVKDIEIADDLFRDVKPTFTPEVKFTAVGRYTWPSVLLDGSVSLQIDGTHASSSFSNINNFDSHIMDASWVGNARLQWVSADERWQVAGFVKNFSDERAQNSTFDLATIGGSDEISFDRQRWYGINIRASY